MENQTAEKITSVKIASYTNDLCGKLFSFCETQEFSDICLIGSDDVRLYAHKHVLSAASDYFMAMFGGSLKEAKESEVKIQEVSGEILKPILAFMYTGTIELQRETIDDTLRAANFFQIKPLTIACCKSLEDNLDVKNCLKIASFAGENKYTELCEKASTFTSKHFEDISNGMDFLKLSEDVLSLIISSEDLCVSSEEKVFLSLIEWIEHDKPNREKCALNLISKVRYWFLSSEFIQQQVAKLCYQVECVQLIITWIVWHASPDSRTLKLKPTKSSEPEKADEIFVISRSRKQTYNAELNTWTCDDFTGYPYSFDKMCVLNNKLIYSYNRQPLQCFDLETKETSKLPELYLGRYGYGLAVLKDELYAVGGRTSEDKKGWTRCVDKYNFTSGQWQSLPPMNLAPPNPQTCLVGGDLYAVSDGKDILVQCFNSKSNKWTTKPSINHSVYSNTTAHLFGISEANEKLFIVGGEIIRDKSLSSYLSGTVNCFDTFSNKWEHVSDMHIKLRNSACISLNNQLIVCGGYDDTGNPLNLLQEYNPTLKKWTHLCPPNPLHFGGSFAILKMENPNV